MEEQYLNSFKVYRDDTIFSNINKHFISLKDQEIKANNEHLRRILTEGLIPIMKRNALFNEIYKKIKYAGSFYKGTKVGKPNEYDLDLIVQLPLNYASLELETDHEHYGYVKIKVGDQDKLPEWEKHSKILNKWIDNGYLNQNKFRQWMESVMSKTFDQLGSNDTDYDLTVDHETYVLERFSKSGPAFTLYIRLKDDPIKNEIMSVDIVPSLEFNDRILNNYKTVPGMALAFVAIPKPLDRIVINGNNLWRLSFYEQEKRILSKKEFAKMKPVIRMLKKFRDRQQMKPIASYFIETLCLHELMCRESDITFFRGPLTGLFMFMLTRLSEVICAKCLYFFWHDEHNLLSNINESVMENYGNRIQNILTSIEKRYVKNKFVIAEQILTPQEFAELLTKIAEDKTQHPSTSSMNLITDEPSGSHPDVGNASCDVKRLTDEMLENYNINELTPDEMEILMNNIKDKLPPAEVEEIRSALSTYVKTEEKTSYWRPFGRFLNKILSPGALVKLLLIIPTVNESGNNRREIRESESANIKLYKPLP